MFVVLAVFIIVGIPVSIASIPSMRVSDVSVTGAVVVPQVDIQNFVKQKISEKHLFLFPKSNVALFPEKEIENLITKNYPRVETVTITFPTFKSARIEIAERKTFAIWCKSEDSQDCYSLDSHGYIFDRAPIVTPSVFFIYRGEVTDNPVGQTYLVNGLFEKMNTFLERVHKLGLAIESVSNIGDDQYELFVKDDTKILFTLRDGNEKMISNLSSIIENKTVTVQNDGTLDVSLVDLRHGNKVIIKKKGE